MYRQVTVEEADALHLLGVRVMYKFKDWNDGTYSRMGSILASEPGKKIPSKFFAVYDHLDWIHFGTPTFYVEAE